MLPVLPSHGQSKELRGNSHPEHLTTHPRAQDAMENMLRRKTPRGTLGNAYDGRPHDEPMGSPATKIMRSNHADSVAFGAGRHMSWEPSRPGHPQFYSNSEAWSNVPVDSINPYAWSANTRVPTVLQPWHPAMGPTASNPQQGFGPYWPDGSYTPYRPAYTGHSANEIAQANQHMLRTTYDPQQGSYHGQDMVVFKGASNHNVANSHGAIDGRHLVQNSHGIVHPHVSPHGFSMQKDVAGHFMGDSQTLPLHYGGQPLDSSIAQNRDTTLVWAQRIYAEFLQKLQSAKGNSVRRQSLQQSYNAQRSDMFPSLQGQTINSTAPPFVQTGFGQARPSQPIRPHAHGGWNETLSPRNQHDLSSTTYLLDHHVTNDARIALTMLTTHCERSSWSWIDGLLLGGCLAYGLQKFDTALEWYSRIVSLDPNHVEARSNLAATLLALNRRREAEQHWTTAIKSRPNHFEAVEHLVGLLCNDKRSEDAIQIIDFVEKSLQRLPLEVDARRLSNISNGTASSQTYSTNSTFTSDQTCSDLNSENMSPLLNRSGAGAINRSSDRAALEYNIPPHDVGRMLSLVHAKGNLLYSIGNIQKAFEAFESVVRISMGRRLHGSQGLIHLILFSVSASTKADRNTRKNSSGMVLLDTSPPLLPPELALKTAMLVFGSRGELPGLEYLRNDQAKRAAISTTSNSLLSLAKILQDSLSNVALSPKTDERVPGVGDILALYYLSLSLQPSPSTANNVGILLASIHQPVSTSVNLLQDTSIPALPGVAAGSGIALALSYYNYGLNLDPRHAHLYTNLGSLLKDIGQLNAAIKMYEQAIACDGHFDIALANLANAVKDQGRIREAIVYYRRAVTASPNFAEAVCGLANALNSVCDWRGRGGIILEGTMYDRWHIDDSGEIHDARKVGVPTGWMSRVVDIVRGQLTEGSKWGQDCLTQSTIDRLLTQLESTTSNEPWASGLRELIRRSLEVWSKNAWVGARVTRLIERAVRVIMRRRYINEYVDKRKLPITSYTRPSLPDTLSVPNAPTVLPFHTFTCPLTAMDVRGISQRNALRISHSTARAGWLSSTVYPPPAPPNKCLNIGYVSSDFNNHPLAHLMQSVFGLHDPHKARAFCYATTASDGSPHRRQIEREAPVFYDAHAWSTERLIDQVLKDGIHILVNLNGYTRGARNELFAARPVPIQMAFMGFAGSLGASWCDYLLADEISVPCETLRPHRRNLDLEDLIKEETSVDEKDWIYSENIIYCKETFFCCDHKQSSKDVQLPWIEEQARRWTMRKALFPKLPDTAVILGNFNQLYKIEPTTFRTWLRILAKVPKAILWLLRFPDLGESNLRKTAEQWAGIEVASRIYFTDVAPKGQHITRARICDLFLDTPECNAHTTAADVLWSSTPILTLPRYKYKMCSRMAASILTGAFPKSEEGQALGKELIASDEDDYERSAIELASGLNYGGSQNWNVQGRLIEMRRILYEGRHTAPLFDTARWVRDLERAYEMAWDNWINGVGGDIRL